MGFLPKHIKVARHRRAMRDIAMAALRGATFEYRNVLSWNREGARIEWRAVGHSYGGHRYTTRFYDTKGEAARLYMGIMI
jgi:hypothetical protein